ncbi:MAG: hypothetical protein IJN94_07320 [Clostridia bacterium]|nr:hypothetical protein [Clostridia bacterium]
MKNKTKNTAISGLMTALSVVLMMLTTLVPVFMYVIPIATGLVVLFVADISDKKWGVGVYFSTAFLSLFLITDKEAALTYALFFGYYPLIKDIIEKLPKAWGWLLKLALFNASAVGIGVISFYLFGVSGEEYEEFGEFTIPILLIMANVAFVLYDFCITKNRFLLMRLSERFKKIIK